MKKNKYASGSFVGANPSGAAGSSFSNYAGGISSAAGFASGILGMGQSDNVADTGLDIGQGVLSGVGAGAAFGPIGMGVGALVGGVSGLISSNAKRKRLNELTKSRITNNTQEVSANMTTMNPGMYGNSYGDGGPINANPLSDKFKTEWNGFIDHMHTIGRAGGKDLDVRDKTVSQDLLNDYIKKNKTTQLSTDSVGRVQKELNDYRMNAWNLVQQKKATTDAKSLDEFMPNLSQVDGWLGSKTSQVKFPNTTIVKKQIPNQNVALNQYKYKDGGEVNSDQNEINIEKNELLIDPDTGKILQEYTGINPLTGGKFQPHSKGKDTKHNFTMADPGLFVINVKNAKKYKDAIETNDKLSQKTILMNIQNNKISENGGLEKMANGGNVDPGYEAWRKSLPKNLQEDKDYDLQGYYRKYGNQGPASNGHLTDEFKRPNHVTFSDESIYSNSQHQGGHWSQNGSQWQFAPSQYNIKNVGKDSLNKYFKINEPNSTLKFADGGDVPGMGYMNIPQWNPGGVLPQGRPLGPYIPQLPQARSMGIGNIPTTSMIPQNAIQAQQFNAPMTSNGGGAGFNWGGALDSAAQYGAPILNIARGLFDKPNLQNHVNPITNPYKNQILANLPSNINLNPMFNQVRQAERGATQDLRNSVNNSAVYRANRQQIGTNASNQINDIQFKGQLENNSIAQQRAGIYNSLGAQDMQEQARVREYNLGIDSANNQVRGNKQNILNTGLSQLSQVYQNNKANKRKQQMDKYSMDILSQIYPNTKYYNMFKSDYLDQ